MAATVRIGSATVRADLAAVTLRKLREAMPAAGKAGAVEAIKQISTASSRGIAADGSAFPAYSDRYLKLKREAGRWRGVVNLTMLGDMWLGFKWLGASNGGFRQTIGWGDHAQQRAFRFGKYRNIRVKQDKKGRPRFNRSVRRGEKTVPMASVVAGLQRKYHFLGLESPKAREAVARAVSEALAKRLGIGR